MNNVGAVLRCQSIFWRCDTLEPSGRKGRFVITRITVKLGVALRARLEIRNKSVFLGCLAKAFVSVGMMRAEQRESQVRLWRKRRAMRVSKPCDRSRARARLQDRLALSEAEVCTWGAV